jgi:hypothetical protein
LNFSDRFTHRKVAGDPRLLNFVIDEGNEIAIIFNQSAIRLAAMRVECYLKKIKQQSNTGLG